MTVAGCVVSIENDPANAPAEILEAASSGAIVDEAPVSEPAADAIPTPLPISLDQRLVTGGYVAVFAEADAVVAYDRSGALMAIVDEPFAEVIIDHDARLMWLDRTWSDTHREGLHVLDLLAESPAPIHVTRLTRGTEIIGVAGAPLLMTEGSVPYKVYSDTNPATITMLAKFQCGAECTPSRESSDLLQGVLSRYLGGARGPSPVSRFSCPPLDSIVPGTELPIGLDPIHLRMVEMYGHTGKQSSWQLFDGETQEYISSFVDERSPRPLKETNAIQHLMVCDRETVVIERQLFTRDLIRLDRKGHKSYGVCLHAGVLFEDKTGFIFEEH